MVPVQMLCDLDDPRVDAAYIEDLVMAGMRMPSTLLKASSLPRPARILRNVFANINIFAKMLPGGRFLVTAALEAPEQHISNVLQLWDLAAPDGKVLAATRRFDKPILDCEFGVTLDLSAVRLVVLSGNRCVGISIAVSSVLTGIMTCAVPSCLMWTLWRSDGQPSSQSYQH